MLAIVVPKHLELKLITPPNRRRKMTQSENEKNLSFRYNFKFENGSEKSFDINLDNKTLNLQIDDDKDHPPWTELSYYKCANCTLKNEEVKYCPAAVSLKGLVEFFKSAVSFDQVEVLVQTEARNYSKTVPLQKALSSLIGIYLTTCGCPVLEKLKPMVRHHLPFASVEETKYRVMSMYLLAQYLRQQKGLSTDWELKDLKKIYDEIRVVNKYFSRRLSDAILQDASVNAMVILNTFADIVSISIDQKIMDELESSFNAYIS